MKRSVVMLVMTCALLVAMNAKVASVSYYLNEGFESGIPATWTQQGVIGDATWDVEGTSGQSLSNPVGVVEGSQRAFLRNSSSVSRGYVTKLITPVLDLSGASSPVLVFSHAQVARQGLFDTLSVYYRLSATKEWVLLRKFDSPITVWKQDTIELVNLSPTTQLAFEVKEADGLGVVLDDVRVMNSSLCMDASFMGVAADPNEAKIEWTGDWGGVNFELAVFPTAVDIATTTDFSSAIYHDTTLTDFSAVVTGLTPMTRYYAYLRSDCEDNETGYTRWTSTTFETHAKINSLPYDEDFNDLSGNYTFPVGWTRGHHADLPDVPFVYAGTASGTKGYYSADTTNFMMFCGAQSYSAPGYLKGNDYAYASLPALVTAPLNTVQVDFWGTAYNMVARTSNNYYDNLLVVGVMTNPDEVSTFVAVDTVTIESAFQHKHFVVNFSGYTGMGKYIAFYAPTRNGSNVFAIDKIHVDTIGVPVPTHLKLVDVSPTAMTISVDKAGADSWNLFVANRYQRDALPADIALSQAGITASSYQLQLPDSLAGKTVVVYAQGVKNGEAGAVAFPLTVRIPAHIAAFPYAENFNVANTVQLKTLNNELHTKSSAAGISAFYFPLHDFSFCYPIRSTSNPKYDNTARLQLQGIGTWVTLGYIDTLSTKEISFRLASGSTTGAFSRVALGVMTNPYDSTTFEQLAVYEGPVGSYQKCLYDFDQYSGSGHYIAFKNLVPPTATTNNCGANTAIDDISVILIPTCREVTDVTEVIGVTKAQFSWDANTMQRWQVVVCADAAMTDTIQSRVVTVPAYTATGLTTNTSYYYKVNTICGTDTIQMESAHKFLTFIGIPYSEPFETASLPAGWNSYRGLANDIFAGASFAASNVNYSWALKNTAPSPMVPYSPMVKVTGKTTKEWLITPSIMLATDEDGIRLTFDMAATSDSYTGKTNWGNDDCFMVIVSDDNGATWKSSQATVWSKDRTADFDLSAVNEMVQSYAVDLSAYRNKTVRIAFYAESTLSGSYEDNALFIDNVQVNSFDQSCAGISSVVAASKSAGTVDVNWSANGLQQVQIVVSERLDLSNPVHSQVTNLNPYVVPGLESKTTYYVGVRQACDTLGEFRTVELKTSCDATPVAAFGVETFDDMERFDCWRVGLTDAADKSTYPNAKTIVNALPELAQSAAYGSYLKISKQANTETAVNGDGQYAILPELSFSGDTITKYQVSFDAGLLNKDTLNAAKVDVGVVVDPTDMSTFTLIKSVMLEYATDSTELGSFTIPFNEYTGDYDENYGNYVGLLLHAGDSANQVVIDNVRMSAISACPQLYDLTLSALTPSGVSLKWDATADSYDIVVTPERTNDPLTYPDVICSYMGYTSDSLRLTGLTAGSNYYIYFRSHCGANSSQWSTPFRFKTKLGVPFTETFTEVSFKNDWTIMDGSLDGVFADTVTLKAPEAQHWYTAQLSGFTGLDGTAARLAQYSAKRHEWLISPLLDCSDITEGTSLQLSFGAALGAYQYFANLTTPMSGNASTTSQRLCVVFSTDGGLTWQDSTMVEISNRSNARFTYNSMNGNGTIYRVNVDFLAGYSDVLIAFYGESTSDSPQNYLYLDEITLQKVNANCAMPTGITVMETTFNAARVRFSSATSGASYQYACVKSGAALRNSTPVYMATGDSALISGLEPSTKYDIYVRQYCGEGNESAWFGPVNFKTLLGVRFSDPVNTLDCWSPYTGKVSEAFEGVLPKLTNNNYSGWIMGSSYSISGMATGHAVCKLYSNNTDYWLISKPIDMSNMTGHLLQLSFDYGLTSDNGSFDGSNEDLLVLVSTDGGQSWPETNGYLIARGGDKSNSSCANKAQHFKVSLSRFAGETIQLAFVARMNTANAGYNYDYHHLANVVIDSVDWEPFEGVSRIRVNQVRHDAAQLTFIARSTQIDHHVYTIVPQGYDKSMGEQHISINSSVQVANLEPSTDYDVYAYSVGQLGDTSEWVGPVSFRTACLVTSDETYDFEEPNVLYLTKYGLPFSMPDCWMHINSSTLLSAYSTVRKDTSFVVMGQTQEDTYHRTGNSSLLLSSSGESFNTYAIMPAVAGLDSLKLRFWARPGYDVSLDGSTSFQGISEEYERMLYVGTMTDPTDASTYTELYSYEMPSSSEWREYVLNLSGAVGSYVAFRSTGSNLYTVDDVSFAVADACDGLLSAPVLNVTSSGMTATWAAADSAQFQVYLDSVGVAFDSTKVVLTSEASYSATGLKPNTKYNFWVRAYCDDANQSEWEKTSFTTERGAAPEPDCSAVEQLVVDSVSHYYARLTYQLTDGSQTAVFQLASDAQFRTILRIDTVHNGAPMVYTALTPAMTYYVRAAHACDANTLSAYVQLYVRTPELVPEVVTLLDSICTGYDYANNGFNVPESSLHVGLNTIDRYDAATNVKTVVKLFVTESKTTDLYASLCEGEHYGEDGFDFTAAKGMTAQRQFLQTTAGCDSMVVLHLTVNAASYAAVMDSVVKGDSYQWNGRELTSAGIYHDTLQNSTGCDSIVTLTLSYKKSTSGLQDLHVEQMGAMPNPVDAGQSFQLVGHFGYGSGVLRMHTLAGALIKEEQVETEGERLPVAAPVVPGAYTVSLQTSDKRLFRTKILVK